LGGEGEQAECEVLVMVSKAWAGSVRKRLSDYQTEVEGRYDWRPSSVEWSGRSSGWCGRELKGDGGQRKLISSQGSRVQGVGRQVQMPVQILEDRYRIVIL